ncbi:hypothetical protein [Leyella stercorea]|nr:hypothetical protein [Leyella stercorea]
MQVWLPGYGMDAIPSQGVQQSLLHQPTYPRPPMDAGWLPGYGRDAIPS